MSSVFRKYSTSIRIGELLVLAGMLTKAQMTEATRHSGSKRLQIGQILVMYGYLTPRDLQTALDAQAVIRDKSVDIDTALRCLKVACKTEANFMDVLHEQTGIGHPKVPPDKLGQLLFEAEIVSREQLSLAMQRSLSTGLPLGHMLGLDDVVSDTLLSKALIIQTRLRDDMMTRPEAIKALREAAGLSGPMQFEGTAQLAFQQPRKRGIRLGEMMVLAGLLTDTDVMNALEWGLINNQPIGHVLSKKANVKQEVIDAALALQLMVDQGKIEAIKACECLAKIAALGISVEQALEEAQIVEVEAEPPVLNYRQLLTLSRVISEEDIETAFDFSTKGAQVIGKFLAASGYMDGPTVRATLKCHYLLSKGLMSQDDAVATLDYCLHHRVGKTVDYDAALSELGWTSKAPLKLSGEPRGSQHGVISPAGGATEARKSPKAGKHTQTISPADHSASQIYKILAGQAEGVTASPEKESATTDDALLQAFSRLAQSYSEQGNFAQSQLVYERILVDRLNKMGPNHVSLIGDLKNLAGVLCCQGKFNQAETFMRRTIAILEANREPHDEELRDVLSILAGIYYRQEKFTEAEPLAERVVRLHERMDGNSMGLVDALNDQAKVLRKLGRLEQAEGVYTRAQDELRKLGSV